LKCNSCTMAVDRRLEANDPSDLANITLHNLGGPGVDINSW
jgi:hypothetical protein